MYDGCGACWTDFCHLIFREGNEKFHTRMCVCVCVYVDGMERTLDRLLGSDLSER